MSDKEARNTDQDPDSGLDIDAASLVAVLAGQLSSLHSLVVGLENSVSQNICACNGLSDSAIHTMQRVDYLRQSLKDIAALLTHVGPSMDWKLDTHITAETLRDLVDMQDSLRGIVKPPNPSKTVPQHDIWL